MDEPKKRGRKPDPNGPKQYFGEREEKAIVEYLSTHDTELKNKLFRDIIDPALRHLVKGVMRMPKFQKIVGIPLDILEEDAYYHVVFSLDKFEAGRLNEAGQPVRAYSYYGTCAKNYILGEKIRLDKLIAEQGGLPVDITELNDYGVSDDESEKEFEELREDIGREIDKVIEQRRMNQNDLAVGASLKYMLTNWHAIEFQSKNEFLRLLCQYCQLEPPVVGRSLKKFKTAIYDKLLTRKSVPVTKTTKIKVKTSSTSLTPKEQILNDNGLSKSNKMRALYDIGITKTAEIAVLTVAHPAFVATVIRKHKIEKA
jgi:hypothetical protein